MRRSSKKGGKGELNKKKKRQVSEENRSNTTPEG